MSTPDFINELFRGLKTPPQNTHQALKDRMITVIARAKQADKSKFTKLLAADYIRISKEL